MNKTLIFEGAGWEKASSASDIGNCRIRTRIKNNDGEIIYLEMSHGVKGGWVWHCFERDCNETSKWRKLEHKNFVWDKRNLIAFVNQNLNCSFTSLDVQNDGVRVHDTEKPLCESISDLAFES